MQIKIFRFFFHRYNWFKFNEIDDLLNEDIKRQVNKDCILEPWKKVTSEYKNNNFYNQTLSLFQNNHLQCLLERLDIHTMAHSVEARVPFLDHTLIEFINKTFLINIRSNGNPNFTNGFQYFLILKIFLKKMILISICSEK